MPTRFLILLAALPAAGCDGGLYAEVELPEVCKQLEVAAFEAAPVPIHGTLEREFEFALASELPEAANAEQELRLTRLTVSAREGVAALDFIDAASLTILSETGLSPETVLEYRRAAGSTAQEIVAEAGSNDLLPYLHEGKLRLNASMTGTLPTQSWSITVRPCVYVRAKYRYLDGL